MRRRAVVGISGAFAALAAAGCGQLLGAYEYAVRADAGGDGSVASEGDAGDDAPKDGASEACPEAWDAHTCWPCAATTREQLENACTASQCEPFDNARVTGLGPSGALPDVPPLRVDAGGGSAGDAGGADAGAPEAGESDAGVDAAPPGTRCASLPSPLYVSGSSAIKPFLARVALAMGAEHKGTLIYKSQGSCVGVDAILNGTAMRGVGSAGASYWDTTAADPVLGERACDLDESGVGVDLGVSDVFAATCLDLPQGLPANVGDFFGPVQVMAFVVPAGSAQRTISAEAAYFVYGFGERSGVAPWTNESLIFQRSASSGTQNMIARAIGLRPERWLGKPHKTSDDVRASLHVASADANAAIGILSFDYADDDRAQLRVLAFQDFGQGCAYWPDSTPTAADKLNVRDGHYPIWGPLHLLARLDAQGLPLHAGVRTTLGYLSGSVALPGGGNLLQLYAERHIVPLCAMRVTRTSDGGPLASYEPEQPCGCYFDMLVTGHTSCTACTASSSCPKEAPSCSYGYCEP